MTIINIWIIIESLRVKRLSIQLDIYSLSPRSTPINTRGNNIKIYNNNLPTLIGYTNKLYMIGGIVTKAKKQNN